MSKSWILMLTLVLLCAGVALGYGQDGAQGGPPATPPGSGTGPGQQPEKGTPPPDAVPNPAKVILDLRGGSIVNVVAEYGASYPAIVFSHTTLASPIDVRLAPLWFLEEALGLDVQMLLTFVGDPADLVVLCKTVADETVYHAITLTVNGTTYRFRTDEGKPLWNPSGKIKEGTATTPSLQVGTARNMGGEIIRIVPSLITGELTLMLRADDGLIYRIRLAEAEAVLATDFALRDRSRVQVRFALEAGTGETVALQLTTESQQTLRLRDENGRRLKPD
ncbi:MAG: hypothetical protein J0H49_00430 [Acidobacteria bacterium]|nr:hypothetical protein [Acidobacteriota bacterium]